MDVKRRGVRTIVAAIADAAERWRNADFAARVRVTRAIEARTRYSEPVVDYALDALFGSIDVVSIESAIVAELGSLAALDGFVSRAGRPDVTFRARDPIAIVASDSTIGVAIPALVFALCAKGHVRVKDRDDGLTRAFVETLAEELPEIRDAVDVGIWRGDDAEAADSFFRDVGAVVAYGRTQTLVAIRNRLPAGTTFVGFGHRTSIAYIARESLTSAAEASAVASALARDVLLYDGDGCLSPHAIYCESGGAIAPYAFARLLAEKCDEAAIEFPASDREPDAAIARYRDAARFRAAQGSGAVFGGTLWPHVVVLDPPPNDPPPLYGRSVAVYAIVDPAEARDRLVRHALPLEAVALSLARPDLEAFALAAGAARICAVGELQRPPLGGDHGGAGRISPLVRAIYRA